MISPVSLVLFSACFACSAEGCEGFGGRFSPAGSEKAG